MSLRQKLHRTGLAIDLKVNHLFSHLRSFKPIDIPEHIHGSILVARIVGNDLYPRHADGQMLNNLRFILMNEPQLPNVSKVFILNRLFDWEQQAEALRLIAEHSCEAVVIPFVPDEYSTLGWELGCFGGANFFTSPQFYEQDHKFQLRMKVWACGPKVRYAMDVNGARNAAVMLGKTRAEWTVVLDGNCIFTRKSLTRLSEDCQCKPLAPYMIVPMDRLEDNVHYNTSEPDPKSMEEPQIAFHHSAQCKFDQRYLYGFRDKTSLLKSLGVPGDWQHWWVPSWAPSEDKEMAEKYRYRFTKGAVFRLSSGGHGMESAGAQVGRHNSRNIAILGTVGNLNKIYGTKYPEVSDMVTSVMQNEFRGF